MKITLPVGGVEKTFSEEELLEKHFNTETTQGAEEHNRRPTRPTEGVPFEVNPSKIDWTLFQTKREDERQERARKLILEARACVDRGPEKYGKPFETLMPRKTWDWKTFQEQRTFATNLGGHMADWVEQALEWAQRITNGETWIDVCNKPDTASWHRLVIWQSGDVKIVGGAREMDYDYHISATDVTMNDYVHESKSKCTVPLVVLYK